MPVSLVATAVLALASASGAAPPEAVCYDRAVLGHLRNARHFVDLNDFYPGQVMLGGRWDVDIAVDQVLDGGPAPSTLRARVVLTHLLRPDARLLLFVKKGPVEPGKDNTIGEWNGGFIPAATAERPWRVVAVHSARGGLHSDDPGLPPRCAAG
jgi:hypothetical protein